MIICRNAEGVHAHLSKCLRGTCSSVGMLKGYMVRERLGTPGIEHLAHLKFTVFLLKPRAWLQFLDVSVCNINPR